MWHPSYAVGRRMSIDPDEFAEAYATGDDQPIEDAEEPEPPEAA